MSFDSILARSPSIIFQPGGTPGQNLVVTSWAEVQTFIAERQSTVIVFIDDSIAPCHVPASSGVTDCQGRVEFRPRRQDTANFSTLTIDSGATLKSVFKLTGTVFLECNPTGAVPSLDFDYTNGAFGLAAIPQIYLDDNAAIGTATTATTSACIVPANMQLNMFLNNFTEVFIQSASALFNLSAGAILIAESRFSVFESATGDIPPTWVQGPGRFELSYDAGTAGYSNTPGTVIGPGIAFTNAGSEILTPVDGYPDRFPTTFTIIQEIYVDTNGSDTTGNGTLVWPFATIQKALSVITDASTNKRYEILVAPGEYPGAFNVKPWVGITGSPNASGFYGVTEITAAAGAIGFDPSFAASGFSVFWMSDLVFANQLTLNYSASANQQIQGTFYNCDFNSGFSFIGSGTGGVDNWTLDGCLVYGGGTAQGVQFFFTIGGTEFIGGTITIQSAPNAGATESTTWLAQNTAVGAAFSPTAVHLVWAAPTPAGFPSKIDWNNTNCVGQINLDGVNTSAKIAGLRPSDVIQSNGASPASVQPISIEQKFGVVGTVTDILGGFQTAGMLPTTGTIRIDFSGFGGTGGGGGGGAGGAAPGTGGGGSGGATWQETSFDHDLSHRLDVTVGAGGSGGPGGIAPAGAGGTGTDGFPTTATDFTASLILASLGPSSGGGGSVTGGHGGATYGPGVFAPRSTDVAAPYGSGFISAGGIGGLAAAAGTNGQGNLVQQGIPTGTGRWAGGLAGTSAPGQGGGGGGGGVGVFAPGSTGGNSNPAGVPGSPGGGTGPASGSGAGGGAGGTGAADNGGPGGPGSTGFGKTRFILQ